MNIHASQASFCQSDPSAKWVNTSLVCSAGMFTHVYIIAPDITKGFRLAVVTHLVAEIQEQHCLWKADESHKHLQRERERERSKYNQGEGERVREKIGAGVMEEKSVGGISRREDDWASEETGLSEARRSLESHVYVYVQSHCRVNLWCDLCL